ncbi:Argininosuccinate lyase [Delftia tsuruhatensis]|uniref:tripartite tricarboxylate transporter substrate binding protein n=1 Tax=Delftia tsuruhatensis TaxID=180282 RepID=UPI001E6C9BC4|nr:tripartite tricarboxylate transporter substrate binding protein [Delftia tsuruhatensis]CAB5722360.1 Argininosuccinate lyase [Delftia tsuruhatensis]CAC9682345.1 Argininosuccinate lyase [Delftia tsuruhatensis]
MTAAQAHTGFPMKSRRHALALLAAIALPAAHAAEPAAPPATGKPITWIVGFAPGGSLDVLTRQVARQLEAQAGVSVVVENRPGASGAISLQAAAKAPADGLTLVSVPGPQLTPPSAGRQPEVGRELTAVAVMARGAMVLVGPAAGAADNLAELVAAMKARPTQWSYASSGTGTSQHLAGELLNAMADTRMVHVPYKGGGQAVTDVVGGQIPLAMLGVTPVLPHIQSGRLKAYAVTSATRVDSLAAVPTLREAGVPGYEAEQWYAVAVPAATPPGKLAQLNQWINQAIQSPELRPTLQAAGAVATPMSLPDIQRFMSQDNAKWKKLAADRRLAVD